MTFNSSPGPVAHFPLAAAVPLPFDAEVPFAAAASLPVPDLPQPETASKPAINKVVAKRSRMTLTPVL